MRLVKISLSSLFILLLACSAFAGEGVSSDKYTLWFGSHYFDFSDYNKKVAEYEMYDDDVVPEIGLRYFSMRDKTIFHFDGYYFDEKNAYGKFKSTVGNSFKANFLYRSMIKQEGQDLLTEMSAREYLPATSSPGGKMLTHEILDPGADYNTHRQEVLGEIELLLSKRNNLRLVAAHRIILKEGSEQKISSNHCFSCHLTSQTAQVKSTQQQLETGLDADIKDFNVGYRFGYRKYDSNAPTLTAYYDDARHPTLGTSGSEFGGRVIYEDATLPYSSLPETEKVSHKVRFKSNKAKSSFSSAFGYSKATNNGTDLAVESFNGAVNMAFLLNPKSRFIAKASIAKIDADTVFIDLPTYRDGATDGNEYDFDYTRYSSLDRTVAKLSGEYITRVNPKMTLSVLAGYDMTNREDYPVYEDGTSSKKMYGQVRMNYRKGMKYQSRIKYRFESISDPFTSGKGLFEAVGHGDDILTPLVPTSSWVFYFQREGLKYQDITIAPTQVHKFSWTSTYTPNAKVNLNIGATATFDKNSDLDSLDVKHTSFAPNLFINLMPDQQWTISTGYTYNYDLSRHPVTVALFDG